MRLHLDGDLIETLSIANGGDISAGGNGLVLGRLYSVSANYVNGVYTVGCALFLLGRRFRAHFTGPLGVDQLPHSSCRRLDQESSK